MMMLLLIKVVVVALLLQLILAADDPDVEEDVAPVAIRSDVECLALLKHTQYARGTANEGRPDFDTEWNCQLLQQTEAAEGISGRIIKLEALENLPIDIQRDGLESGVDKLFIPSALVNQNSVEIPNGAAVEREKVVDMQNANRRRRLNIADKKVLVVRVKDVGDILSTETSPSAAELSDKVFGTYGKPFNMASQFDACSFGKFKPSPVTSWNEIDPPLSDAGVYTVEITASSKNRGMVQNDITKQLNLDWNYATLPGDVNTAPDSTVPFDFIMYCLPPGTDGGWFAYAYLNSWLSVYNDVNCGYVSFLMHEIGHSIGLDHSGGTNGRGGPFTEYGDVSGLMGYSNQRDNYPRMCFNAAKSWQLRWYEDKARTVDPFASSWTGLLMGIVDMEDTLTDTVLVKIETRNEVDFYMNFNRQSRFNKETKEGGDKVLVTKQRENGKSTMVAELSQGQSFNIPNFRGTGNSAQVRVHEINLMATPAYANVTIGLSCQSENDCQQGSDFLECSTASFCNAGVCTKPPESCNCNNICEASENETGLTCPSDCATSSTWLETTVDQNNGQAGNMFTVDALNDLLIKQFEIHVRNQGNLYDAEVYTKPGSYVGYEVDSSAWTKIQTVSNVESQGLGKLTPLPPLQKPVMVQAGQQQAFYITLTSSNIRYTNGDEAGEVYASDANLLIREGVGKTYGSSGFGSGTYPSSGTGSRIWNGRINYVVIPSADDSSPSTVPSALPSKSSRPSLSPSSSPSSSLVPSTSPSAEPTVFPSIAPSTSGVPSGSPSVFPTGSHPPSSFPTSSTWLETTVDQNNGQAGNMFTVDALNDLLIKQFEIHVRNQGNLYDAEVYTKPGSYVGYEVDSSAWTKIQTVSNVESQGLGELTPLPPLQKPVMVQAGQQQAFYVTLTSSNIRYTNGDEAGEVYASDENLLIREGVGKTYGSSGFGSGTYPSSGTGSRIWNGRINYVVIPSADDSSPPTVPSALPSKSSHPSMSPSSTLFSSLAPSGSPSAEPSEFPSIAPSISDVPSISPTVFPSGSYQPSSFPSSYPTSSQVPSAFPTLTLSEAPSQEPSRVPSLPPSNHPSGSPSSLVPSAHPSAEPSKSRIPSVFPSIAPSISALPSEISVPSGQPTSSKVPSASPTLAPSEAPSQEPSAPVPSLPPSEQATGSQSSLPSRDPSAFPTSMRSDEPSEPPAVLSSVSPSIMPSDKPSQEPTTVDQNSLSSMPPNETPMKSEPPSSSPSTQPSATLLPSNSPSTSPPTLLPSALPTSSFPNAYPLYSPSSRSKETDSLSPTELPSSAPSAFPSALPTFQTTITDSSVSPTSKPSASSSVNPTVAKSEEPSASHSVSPSVSLPSSSPSAMPTLVPSSSPSSNHSPPPTPAPVASLNLSATWDTNRGCTNRMCKLWITNTEREQVFEITSINISWPTSQTAAIGLPYLDQITQGKSKKLWRTKIYVSPSAIPTPNDDWEGDASFRQIPGGESKEYRIRFQKGGDIDQDVTKYSVIIVLNSTTKSASTTIQVEP